VSSTPRPRRPSLLRVGSPDSVLAVIPGLLGFHPDRSLVVVGAGEPRGRIQVAFRYDLPEPPDPGAAGRIAAHAVAILERQRLTLAVVVGYGPGLMVTPVADALVAGLRRAGITLHDMLRVENGRYWSYTCRNPRCCPPEGTSFDSSAHPVAATMAATGNRALRDRAELAATIAPLGGLDADTMRQAARRAERRVIDQVRKGAAAGRQRAVVGQIVAEGLHAVSVAILTYRQGGSITSPGQLAQLAVALTDLRVRDDAWARMDPEYTQAHLRLWTDLVRCVPARYAPAPASLLAFTAWQAGNGALANVAAQRALSADPTYSMAELLLEAISSGLPPSAARLPMTPEEVAASYAAGTAGPASPGTAGPDAATVATTPGDAPLPPTGDESAAGDGVPLPAGLENGAGAASSSPGGTGDVAGGAGAAAHGAGAIVSGPGIITGGPGNATGDTGDAGMVVGSTDAGTGESAPPGDAVQPSASDVAHPSGDARHRSGGGRKPSAGRRGPADGTRGPAGRARRAPARACGVSRPARSLR